MSRLTISVADARRELPAMLDALERGDTYLITRHGKPAGELRPAPDQETAVSGELGHCVLASSARIRLSEAMIARIVAELREGKQLIDFGIEGDTLRLSPRVAIDHLVSHASGSITLTARELEIVRLVAEGKTNREIAERLTLSWRTVEGHVANMRAKLRVKSRVDVVSATGASVVTSVRFRVTTRRGYTFETHGQACLREITDAIDASRDTVHACDTTDGTVYIPTWSVASVAVDPLAFHDAKQIDSSNLSRAVGEND